ncbi:response regulator [Haloglycomyces albus]|uniref:response regulator n=1 Tax=Haloglycomyces albus TaxID=526067 RepID=UPI00046D2010|nr:response regulator transcription factor [Haloglycomyces albus]
MRILLVDDHPVVRAGLAALLAGEEDFHLVARAVSADEAVAQAERYRPDLVLMDLQLGKGTDGIEATRRLRRLEAAPRVLVLTTFDSDDDLHRAMDAGAVGYLLKACPPQELFDSIRAAARGEHVVSPQLASRLVKRMTRPRDELTSREREIVGLLAEGLTNADIAGRLFITEATVKTHVVHILAKLGAQSRTAAVAEARTRGIIR